MDHPYTLAMLFGPPDEFESYTQERTCNACGSTILGHQDHVDWHNQNNI